MKNFFYLIVLIVLSSCDGKPEPDPDLASKFAPAFTVETYRQLKLSTGEVIETPQNISVMHLWKADGKTFATDNTTDLIAGYAFDNSDRTSHKADLSVTSDFSAVRSVPAGRYFIWLYIGSSNGLSNVSSGKYVQLKNGELTKFRKVFDLNSKNLTYESWE